MAAPAAGPNCAPGPTLTSLDPAPLVAFPPFAPGDRVTLKSGETGAVYVVLDSHTVYRVARVGEYHRSEHDVRACELAPAPAARPAAPGPDEVLDAGWVVTAGDPADLPADLPADTVAVAEPIAVDLLDGRRDPDF